MKRFLVALTVLSLFATAAISAPPGRSVMGEYGYPTIQVTLSDDAVHTLESLLEAEGISLTRPSGVAWSLLLDVEDNPVRYAFGVDPVQGGLGHLLEAGTPLRIPSVTFLRQLRLINDTAGAAAVLQLTLEF